MNLIRLCQCLICLSCISILASEPDRCRESGAKSCADCIAIKGCSWCADPLHYENPNLVINGCRNSTELSSCDTKYLYPQSTLDIIENQPLSNVGKPNAGRSVQLKPQMLDIALTPGQPVDIQALFKLVEEFPADVFYLVDAGVNAEKEIRGLGRQLAENLPSLTNDLQFGFGLINGKTEVEPSSEKDFTRLLSDLPLTSQIDDFVDAAANINLTSNTLPVGSDQASFCQRRNASFQRLLAVLQDVTNWRSNAVRLLVFIPSNNFRSVDDGKQKNGSSNNGNCSSDEVVSSLTNKFAQDRISPLFVVPSNLLNAYEIEDVVTKELSSDLSNIIESLQTTYNNQHAQVALEANFPDSIRIINPMSYCPGHSSEGLSCENVTKGNTLNFTLQLMAHSPLAEPATVTLSPRGFSGELRINVRAQNECSCLPDPSHDCSGHGAYDCGLCVCNEGYTGRTCQCDAQGGQTALSYLNECTDPATRVVCNGRGECECGVCVCREYPSRRIDGRYCECDNASCERRGGQICNGAGTCDCGHCRCHEGWTGDACDCSQDVTACYDRGGGALNSSVPCNGNGVCECGFCKCNEYEVGSHKARYRGAFCRYVGPLTCSVYEECVKCLTFGNDTNNDTGTCQERCQNVMKVNSLDEDYRDEVCEYAHPLTNCTFDAYLVVEDATVLFKVIHDFDPSSCNDSSRYGAVVDQPCNGRGVCTCGVCSCETIFGNGSYQDKHCQVSIYCSHHLDCIQCLAFGTGNYNDTKTCQENCQFYEVNHAVESPKDGYDQGCRFRDFSNNFTFNSYIKVTKVNIVVIVTAEEDSKNQSTSYLGLAVGLIIAGVLLIIAAAFCFVKKCRHNSAGSSTDNGKSSVAYTSGKPSVNL